MKPLHFTHFLAAAAAAAPAWAQGEQPNLVVSRALTTERTVVPGETLHVSAVVHNLGSTEARDVRVRVRSLSGWSQETTIARLAGGQSTTVELELLTGEAERLASPHFLTVEVDTEGAIAESDESDNQFAVGTPVFVTHLSYQLPEAPEEHDEVFEVVGGRVSTYTALRYGQDGAPSMVGESFDPDKLPEVARSMQGPFHELEQARVDARLRTQAELAPADARISFIVVYEHATEIPELPVLDPRQGRLSPQNLLVMQEREATFEAVRRMRREAGANVAAEVERSGGRVQEYFTLAGAMLVEVPASQLDRIAALGNVRHLELVEAGELPPNSIADGRSRIASDFYFNGGATGAGFMALLDTGVRPTHTLFNGPDHILIWEDCVFGNSFCANAGSASYNPDDNSWNHGTSTAGILTGNSNLGNASRGVTSSWVDSWKVYSSAGLNTTATLRGFDEAARWGDQIIVAEIQSTQGHTGSIATAADNAFNAGHIIIAAAGNYGPAAASVASPGNAHKALAIGAYDVDTLASQSYSGIGPTPDNRVKPDIKAPTNTRTSSNTGSTALQTFGGTSGATPYAAGAASVFADWFNLTSRTQANAGKVYAALINGGNLSSVSTVNGAGNTALPVNGTLYTGSRNVSQLENEIVSFNVPAGKRVSASIWWPEASSEAHADIDLYIRDAFDITRDSSLLVSTVFELGKAAPATTTNAGTWDLRIYGYNVPDSAQTVYYAIHVY